MLARQGRPGEAEPWVERAERTLRAEAEPAVGVRVHYIGGLVELIRGRGADALAAFRGAELQAGRLVAPDYVISVVRAMLVHALVRFSELEQAEPVRGDLGDQDCDRGELRVAAAGLRLDQHDPHAAAVARALGLLAPSPRRR